MIKEKQYYHLAGNTLNKHHLLKNMIFFDKFYASDSVLTWSYI